MRAKIINEQNFEQGLDPKRAMGIGQSELLDGISGIDAFTHWLYYVDSKFIDEVWGEGTHLGDHFKTKFKGIVEADKSGYITPNALMRFIRELGTNHQIKLYEYILNNHKGKW